MLWIEGSTLRMDSLSSLVPSNINKASSNCSPKWYRLWTPPPYLGRSPLCHSSWTLFGSVYIFLNLMCAVCISASSQPLTSPLWLDSTVFFLIVIRKRSWICLPFGSDIHGYPLLMISYLLLWCNRGFFFHIYLRFFMLVNLILQIVSRNNHTLFCSLRDIHVWSLCLNF